MNNSAITCEDFYIPAKPEPKVAYTVSPVKPKKDFNEWIQYINELLKKTKKK